MQPDVMLFDEVTAALDPETVKEVLVTIRELAEDGMTCMIVTHEMGFAREVADRSTSPTAACWSSTARRSEFFANPRDPRTRQFLDQICDASSLRSSSAGLTRASISKTFDRKDGSPGIRALRPSLTGYTR